MGRKRDNSGQLVPLQQAFDFTGARDVLIDPDHAGALTGLPAARLKTMSKAGQFPPFERLGYRTLRYWRGDVLDWLKCRREGRRWAPRPAALAGEEKPPEGGAV